MFEIVGKFLNWLLPERQARKYILDELRIEVSRLTEQLTAERERISNYEERIKKLEERFEKESCLRFACKHRLSLNELHAPKSSACTAEDNTCTEC